VNKNFGIGFGLEAVSGENQTLTQFAIVVKLSMKTTATLWVSFQTG